MARVLAGRGVLVVEAKRGEDGLVQFERRGFSLAVIEIAMRGMSGLDLAAEIERRQPCFPILYVSSLGESIAMESIARRSPERVLLKPFTNNNFQKRVEQLIGARPALHAH